MLYEILRACWCNIIVLNVHASTEDKIDDIKDRFYEEYSRPLKLRLSAGFLAVSQTYKRVL
jgi:hypothetical protein